VGLDRGLTQHQPRGKLGVAEAPGEQLKDLELSWRQLRQIAVRYGRRGRGRREPLDQPAGMRRGEALALRWRGADLDAATISVRRSAGIVRVAGEGMEIAEGDTKSGKPRVIDLDAPTVTVLRAWRKERGSMALQLARDDALVFGDIEGRHRNGEHVSRQFARDVAAAVRPSARTRSR